MPTAPFLAPERDQRFKVGRPKSSGGTVYDLNIRGTSWGGTATFGSGAGVDNYALVYIDTPVVVDRFSFEVTTVNSSTNSRIGAYRADTDWQPIGAPLFDSGDIVTSSTGIKTYTPGTAIYFQRGRYLAVINHAAGTPALRCSTQFTESGPVDGSTMVAISRFTVARAYAAFPTPGTRWDTVVTGNGPNNQFITFRISQP